jgi:hypothetical protein
VCLDVPASLSHSPLPAARALRIALNFSPQKAGAVAHVEIIFYHLVTCGFRKNYMCRNKFGDEGLNELEAGCLLTVNSCIKVRLDLKADKSPVVVKGPFFP